MPGFWALVGILGGTGLAIAGLALTDDRFVPDVRLPWRLVRALTRASTPRAAAST